MNLNLKPIVLWTTFTNMIVPTEKFGKYCSASRNAEQKSQPAPFSGSFPHASDTADGLPHKNVFCCFGSHMSASVLGSQYSIVHVRWKNEQY